MGEVNKDAKQNNEVDSANASGTQALNKKKKKMGRDRDK